MIGLEEKKLKFVTGNYKTLTSDIEIEDVLYLYKEKNSQLLSKSFIIKSFTRASEDYITELLEEMVSGSYLQENDEEKFELIYE